MDSNKLEDKRAVSNTRQQGRETVSRESVGRNLERGSSSKRTWVGERQYGRGDSHRRTLSRDRERRSKGRKSARSVSPAAEARHSHRERDRHGPSAPRILRRRSVSAGDERNGPKRYEGRLYMDIERDHSRSPQIIRPQARSNAYLSRNIPSISRHSQRKDISIRRNFYANRISYAGGYYHRRNRWFASSRRFSRERDFERQNKNLFGTVRDSLMKFETSFKRDRKATESFKTKVLEGIEGWNKRQGKIEKRVRALERLNENGPTNNSVNTTEEVPLRQQEVSPQTNRENVDVLQQQDRNPPQELPQSQPNAAVNSNLQQRDLRQQLNEQRINVQERQNRKLDKVPCPHCNKLLSTSYIWKHIRGTCPVIKSREVEQSQPGNSGAPWTRSMIWPGVVLKPGPTRTNRDRGPGTKDQQGPRTKSRGPGTKDQITGTRTNKDQQGPTRTRDQ